jgi:hypothetical protein
MASVDGTGTLIECRHTSSVAIQTITDLTVAIWDAANRGGAYSVTSVKTAGSSSTGNTGMVHDKKFMIIKSVKTLLLHN